MRKAAKQIGICAMALILFCVLCRLTVFRTYTAHIPIQERVEQALREDNSIPRTGIEREDVLRLGDITMRAGSVSIPIRPNQAGEADVRLYDQQGNISVQNDLFSLVKEYKIYYNTCEEFPFCQSETAILLSS